MRRQKIWYKPKRSGLRAYRFRDSRPTEKTIALRLIAISAVLLILPQIAKRVAMSNPDLVERYFSRGLYPVTSRVQSAIANLFPFSLYELLIVILILYAFYRLFRLISAVIRRDAADEILRFVSRVLFIVSVGLFLFQFGWSLNNYRIPLKDQLGLTVREATVDELAGAYRAIVEGANQARAKLPVELPSDSGNVRYVLETAWQGYPPLAQHYSLFHNNRVRVKGLYLFSWVQTMSGYTGVFNPITGEPNINIQPPLATLPHTACHEIAHQMGITLEDEASYVGFLACVNHPDPLFAYSGYLSALTYVGNALYGQSKDLYHEISSLLSEEIRADQQQDREFWEKHQKETASQIADKVNESYLKNNNQPEGMQSYGRFVDLLIADYLQDGEL